VSEVAQRVDAEMTIPCPVCGVPRVFIEGSINIDRQLSFFCPSKKCRGKRRFIKKQDLQNIIDKFNKVSI